MEAKIVAGAESGAGAQSKTTHTQAGGGQAGEVTLCSRSLGAAVPVPVWRPLRLHLGPLCGGGDCRMGVGW